MSGDWQPAVPERFDPTHPYNWKWAFDGYRNQAHVWRIPEGTDGRTTHRPEAAELLGRPLKVTQKDSLGLASYIPAEIKLDGTLVAPPHVLVEAYYGHEIPDAVHEELAKMFPDAVVRNARISSVSDPKKPRTNSRMIQKVATPTIMYHVAPRSARESIQREGLNQRRSYLWAGLDDAHNYGTHELQQPYDVWAISTDGLRLERDPNYAPLSEEEPDEGWGDVMLTPPGVHDSPYFDFAHYTDNPIPPERLTLQPSVDDQELRSDFPTDPKYHLREGKAPHIYYDGWGKYTQSAVWASEQFGLPGEGKSSSKWWQRLRRAPVTSGDASGADHEGAMIAIYLPEDVGKQIQVKDGEPIEDMHITLAYFVDKAADRDDWDALAKIVETFSNKHGKLVGKIGGYGVFHNDVDVLWASADLPGVNELRHEIVEACDDAGFMVAKDHSFTPHITLEYDHKGKLPKRDPIDVTFDELSLTTGGNRQDFRLTGKGFDKTI